MSRSPHRTDAGRLPGRDVDVLVPTRDRAGALAVTLAGLAGQTLRGFDVYVSDQSTAAPVSESPAVTTMARVLAGHGSLVHVERNPVLRGLAEQRARLLGRATAPYVLFLDDDVWLEPDTLARMHDAIRTLRCGFVGCAVQGLSYLEDVRPDEQEPFEEWDWQVVPERVRRGGAAWNRWRLHNAANLTHVAERLGLSDGEWRAYKVAWVGGCVLYDTAALRECGGFDFWSTVPPDHAGEDMVAELRVMERYGGAGLVPSGAVHLELPTTVTERRVECYDMVLAGGPAPGTDDRRAR
jgi:GT2 family glycosyltransferase